MPTRNDRWLVTARQFFTVDFWNGFVRDLTGRLSRLEEREPALEALAATVAAEAATRVNNALASVITMIEGVAEIGMVLTVNATGAAEIGPGTKTLVVALSQRGQIGTTGYVVARPAGDANVRMGGIITAYDDETGELTFSVVAAHGDGASGDWVIAYAKPVVEGPAGPRPAHRVVGNDVQFQNPDLSWGDPINIFGDEEAFGLLASSQIASQAEAEAAANNTKALTPLRGGQQFAALFAAKLASNAASLTGTSTTLAVTPAGLKYVLDAVVDRDLELAQLLASVAHETGQAGAFYADGFTADTGVVAPVEGDHMVRDAGNTEYDAATQTYYSNAGLGLAASQTLTSSAFTSGSLAALKDATYSAGIVVTKASELPFWVKADLGVAKSIRAFSLRSSSATAESFVLEGSNDDATWTTVHTNVSKAPYDPQSGGQSPYSLAAASTAYRYWRCTITAGNTGPGTTFELATFLLFEAVPAGNSILRSVAIPSLAVPDKATGILQLSAGDLTGVSFEMSRDSGTTWTNCPLTSIGTQNGSVLAKFENVSLAAQPSGSTIKWRATIPVGRSIRGVAFRTKGV